MASLSAGVLLKLLQEMEMEPSTSISDDDDNYFNNCSNLRRRRRPSLLQVTSIIPALSGNDLFPDRGFYLQVSDSSHSTYVSLPPNQTDLILTDRLQLGQLIHVHCLQLSHPVPILRGLRLLPGRHRLSASICSTSAPGPPSFRNVSRKGGRSIPTSPMKEALKWQELERGRSDVLSELIRIRVTCMDEESEEEEEEEEEEEDGSRLSRTSSSISYSSSSSSSSSSCVLTPKLKPSRKSWDVAGGIKERRQEVKPLARTRSACVSRSELVHCSAYMPKNDTLDDLLAGKRNSGEGLKVLGNSSKRKLSVSNGMCTNGSCESIPFGSFDKIKWPEKSVEWASLPSSLVKHGKEVLRQRELSLNAAVDALFEASASERLVQCLSMYSELQSDKEADPQNIVDKFLDFHQSLSEARLLTQSLAKLSPLRTRAAANDALQKKKCAASWIKAALESDLAQFPISTNSTTDRIEFSATDAKLLSSLSKQRNSTVAVADLENALSSECNRWFLRYIEKYLNAVQNEINYSGCESQIASLLCQLKRIDDWLDAITSKERAWPVDNRQKGGRFLEDVELEACGRVREKIYGVLLRHVECAAIALESMGATQVEKEMR